MVVKLDDTLFAPGTMMSSYGSTFSAFESQESTYKRYTFRTKLFTIWHRDRICQCGFQIRNQK